MAVKFKYIERSDTLNKILAATEVVPGQDGYAGAWTALNDVLGDVFFTVFVKTLSNVFTTTIPGAEHNISDVRDIKLFTPDMQDVSIAYSIDNGQDVTIYSNVSLLNHIVKIY